MPVSTSPPGNVLLSRPAVFLDRDGTIIEDTEYLSDPDAVRFLPGADRAIVRLTRAGLPVVVITNQSGIGRGFYTEEQYEAVRARLDDLLAEAGAGLLASYHCPHGPAHDPPCDCRKPAAGLFQRAAAAHDLDLSRSFFVGDRLRDLVAGQRAGGRCFLIRSGDPERDRPVPGIELVDSLADAVGRILG
jgi:histidinol-phosphate phosphatase family protein